jgi:hypothetical protein
LRTSLLVVSISRNLGIIVTLGSQSVSVWIVTRVEDKCLKVPEMANVLNHYGRSLQPEADPVFGCMPCPDLCYPATACLSICHVSGSTSSLPITSNRRTQPRVYAVYPRKTSKTPETHLQGPNPKHCGSVPRAIMLNSCRQSLSDARSSLELHCSTR